MITAAEAKGLADERQKDRLVHIEKQIKLFSESGKYLYEIVLPNTDYMSLEQELKSNGFKVTYRDGKDETEIIMCIRWHKVSKPLPPKPGPPQNVRRTGGGKIVK